MLRQQGRVMGRTLQGQSELRIQDDRPTMETKKADVAEHLEVFDHVGLLFNEPSSDAGMLFV
jgi:hypothetical protein